MPTHIVMPGEAAASLGITTQTLRRWTKAGKTPEPLRIGFRLRWNREEWYAWLKAGCLCRADWEQLKRLPK